MTSNEYKTSQPTEMKIIFNINRNVNESAMVPKSAPRNVEFKNYVLNADKLSLATAINVSELIDPNSTLKAKGGSDESSCKGSITWTPATIKSAMEPNLGTDEFTLFSHLPTEIRLKIWRLALPGPRKLTIKPIEAASNVRGFTEGQLQSDILQQMMEEILEYLPGGSTSKRNLVTAATPVPVMLHACRESRAVALTVYKVSFAAENTSPIYFDPTHDVVLQANTPLTSIIELSMFGMSCFAQRTVIPHLVINVSSDPLETGCFSAHPGWRDVAVRQRTVSLASRLCEAILFEAQRGLKMVTFVHTKWDEEVAKYDGSGWRFTIFFREV